jgi:hypothetical protein
LAVSAAITMEIYQPASLSVVSDEPIVLFKLETWSDKRFQLLGYTDIGGTLKVDGSRCCDIMTA